MNPGLEFLSVLRVTKVVQALQDIRELPQDLVFLRRTPVVPAVDGEIMGRFIGRVLIADIIADDAGAVTYSYGKTTFETTPVPNIKIGRNLTQSQINQLNAMASAGTPNEMMLMEFIGPLADGLLLSVRQRMEAMLVGMHLDNLNYDRLGMKMSGIGWGMPSDLKVTTTFAWTDTVNADPISDLLSLSLEGSVRYGVKFNRAIMSTQALRYAIATTKFQNQAKVLLRGDIGFTNLNLLNLQQQRGFLETLTGMAIETYDARYWTQAADGTVSSAPYLPINKVIVDSTLNDNNPAVKDFANGIVTESLLSAMMPNAMGTGMMGRFSQGMRGPLGYATVPADLNPPNVTMWGVGRGFPRKYVLQANAVLTVGSFTDQIPVGEPF